MLVAVAILPHVGFSSPTASAEESANPSRALEVKAEPQAEGKEKSLLKGGVQHTHQSENLEGNIDAPAEGNGSPQIKGSVRQAQEAETPEVYLQGNVGSTDAGLNDMHDAYKKLERSTLLLMNENQRKACCPPGSPNVINSTLIPGRPAVEMGNLPPRDRMVRILLTEINKQVRHLQMDERAIHAAIITSNNDTLKSEWKLVVGTTADIIAHYRELEAAALSPPYDFKVINKCSLRIYEDTHGLDRFWQPIRQATRADASAAKQQQAQSLKDETPVKPQ